MIEESEEKALEREKVRELAQRKMCWRGNSESKIKFKSSIKEGVE